MLDDGSRKFILEVAGAKEVSREEHVQSLWSGYGVLVRVEFVDAAPVIVKHIRPRADHGRGDASHRRKLRSYEVESTFYARYAPHCDDSMRVARLLGQAYSDGGLLLVLEDLDHAGFGHRARERGSTELVACLDWLAHFHARFMGQSPEGLWAEGSYWHLATRREELAALGNPEVTTRAVELDGRLTQGHFRTFVHGDAKPANFCFSTKRKRVAAVDFQYVGGGCGMRDVAYLLHETGQNRQARGLDAYFETLRAALSPSLDADALEQEWRELYPIAVADFERFLVGWGR